MVLQLNAISVQSCYFRERFPIPSRRSQAISPSKSRDLAEYALKTGLKVLKLLRIEKLEHVEVTNKMYLAGAPAKYVNSGLSI